jgi:hypothetical protein
MAILTAKTCETSKPLPGRDRLLGDGDGLFLRIRPNATKTWVIEYEFKGTRRKSTIGVYDGAAAPGESITAWLEHGRLSLSHIVESRVAFGWTGIRGRAMGGDSSGA